MQGIELPPGPVAILGYGREGKSVHNFFRSRFPEREIAIFDRNDPLLDEASAAASVFFGERYLEKLDCFPVIVRSPGIPPTLPGLRAAVDKGARVTTLTNLFMQAADGRTIGVTGTKGKSTTSALIAAMLGSVIEDVRLVGNIGAPALDHLHGQNSRTCYVLELSSFQLEDIHYSPNCAVLLEVVPEHLDHHGSFEEYLQAKLRILRYQQPEDLAVLKLDAAYRCRADTVGPARRVYYSNGRTDCEVCAHDGSIHVGGKPLLPLADIPLVGPGNVENVMAALTVAQAFGVPADRAAEAVRAFKPLPHRLELVGTFHGIRFYNDSLATIPQATINALDGLGAEVQTLILGGYDRGIDFQPLGEALGNHMHHLHTVILFPTTGAKIWEALLHHAPPGVPLPRSIHVTTMEEAARAAYQHTTPGTICLMSPASSSFHTFRDYIDRGNSFKQAIRSQAPHP